MIALGAAAAVGLTFLVPPSYIATAQLVILPSPTEILRLADYHSTDAADGGLDMKTQLDIMRSDRVLQRAAERLGLANDPNLLAAYQTARTRATMKQFGVEMLEKGLAIIPAKDSRVVTVSYEGNDAKQAADRANAIVDAFQEINAEFVSSSARQSAVDFSKRIDVTHLNNLSTELETARTQLSMAKSRYAARLAARKADGDMTAAGVIDSPALQGLRLAESQALAELQSTADRLGQEHPDYKEHVNRLHAIRTQIDAEIRRIVAGLSVDVQAAERHYEDVKLKFDMQRRSILSESSGQGDAAPADMSDDAALPPGSAKTSNIGATPQTSSPVPAAVVAAAAAKRVDPNLGMMVLQRAEPPFQGQNGKMRMNAVFGGIFGLILGIVGAAIWDLKDLRIRGPHDVERWLDIPNLAEIPVCSTRDIRSDIKALAPPLNPRIAARPEVKGGANLSGPGERHSA